MDKLEKKMEDFRPEPIDKYKNDFWYKGVYDYLTDKSKGWELK